MDNGEYHARYPMAHYTDAAMQDRWLSVTPHGSLVDEILSSVDDTHCFYEENETIPPGPNRIDFQDHLSAADQEQYQKMANAVIQGDFEAPEYVTDLEIQPIVPADQNQLAIIE